MLGVFPTPLTCESLHTPEPRQGRSKIARRGIAATKLLGPESTPGPACAEPPPPAGDRCGEIHVTRFAVLCPPLAGVEHRQVLRGWILVSPFLKSHRDGRNPASIRHTHRRAPPWPPSPCYVPLRIQKSRGPAPNMSPSVIPAKPTCQKCCLQHTPEPRQGR
jgi:hypothetical protein